MSLGDEYYQAGDFQTAGDWFTKVTKLEPTNIRSFLALGASAFNLGDQATAETAWNRAVAIDDKNVEAHYDLGFLYLNRQPADMTGVTREWTRVVELDPNSDTAKTVKAHLDAFASAAPGSPDANASPDASPAPTSSPTASAATSAAPSPASAAPAAPSAAPATSPAPAGSTQP